MNQQAWHTSSRLIRLCGFLILLVCFTACAAAPPSSSTSIAPPSSPAPVASMVPINPISLSLTAQTTISPTVVQAIFQPFESGWLLWWPGDGFYYVFLSYGSIRSYPESYIPASADDVIVVAPIPNNRVPVADVFANLWRSKRWAIAPMIGWATAPAQQYQAHISSETEFGFGISLPNGETVNVGFGGRWRLGGVSGGEWQVTGKPPTFSTETYPTPTPLPTPVPPEFNAIYQPFEHGFMLWRADRNCVYAFSTEPKQNIVIPRELLAQPSGNYNYCLDVAALPDVTPSGTAPTRLQIPTGVVGNVWGNYADIRSALGYAVDTELLYSAQIPNFACSDQFTCSYMPPLLTLPDGRILACGMRAASSGQCTLSPGP